LISIEDKLSGNATKDVDKTNKIKDTATRREDWDMSNEHSYDKKLESKILKRTGNPDFEDWSDKKGSVAQVAGRGAYGFVTVNEKGQYIKRGILGENEASILKKVGAKDLGPDLIAADLNGRLKTQGTDEMGMEHLGLRHGRIAMTKVPGRDIESLATNPEQKVSGTPAADIYWKALADLHRLGVAHNDAHPGNLFVEEKTGKGRWVDFGLSQQSFKASLAESLGAFYFPGMEHGKGSEALVPADATGAILGNYGNWQTREWKVMGMHRVDKASMKPSVKKLEEDLPILGTVRRNRFQVDKQLKEKFGLSEDEVVALYMHGTQSPLKTFEQGPWSKLSEADAKDLVSLLYKGV